MVETCEVTHCSTCAWCCPALLRWMRAQLRCSAEEFCQRRDKAGDSLACLCCCHAMAATSSRLSSPLLHHRHSNSSSLPLPPPNLSHSSLLPSWLRLHRLSQPRLSSLLFGAQPALSQHTSDLGRPVLPRHRRHDSSLTQKAVSAPFALLAAFPTASSSFSRQSHSSLLTVPSSRLLPLRCCSMREGVS